MLYRCDNYQIFSKRAGILEKVKQEMESIRSVVKKPKNVYTSLNAKILNFCVTQWTVRVDALNNTMKNYEVLLTLFSKILIDKTEKK